MDTKEFLDSVLPRAGLKVLAIPRLFTGDDGQERVGWRYTTYQATEAMAEAALQFDARGDTVYFAVQGYGDWYEELNAKTGKMRRRIRTQKNVEAMRALYDDFDVSQDPAKDVYRSREDALQGVLSLAKTLRLSPTITSSGGGYHFYLMLDDDVPPDVWMELAVMKRRITRHLELKTDPAVDIDSARILRPIGTHNYKGAEPRPVELVRAGKPYPATLVRQRMDEFIAANNVPQVAIAPREVGGMANPFAMATGDYPPSSALRVIEHCAALRSIAEVHGDVAEPLWRAMLGLVKYTEEGDELCHEWSAGCATYDESETQSKLDNWATGPTLCETFNSHLGCRAECPHAERVRSPIWLGQYEDAPSATEAVAEPVKVLPGIVVDDEHLPLWPDGYRWNGTTISKAIMVEGIVEYVPFSRSLFYPTSRTRVEDGTWAMRFRARKLNGKWFTFDVPTGDVASSDVLARSLAQYEVFLVDSKRSKMAMTAYVQDYILGLQQADIGSVTVHRYGWHSDPDGFVLGDQIILGDESRHVLCGKDIPGNLRDVKPSGTLQAWIDMTDRIANRPNAEIIQLALCHAFGAPLVYLMEDDNWHGIPIGLVGASGSGKTTLAGMACDIYGPGSALAPQGTQVGSTLNGAIKMMSVLNGVPYLLDELSGRDPKEITDLVYAAGNGKSKIRIDRTGGWATTSDPWYTNGFLTSNDSIYALLGLARNEDVAVATQLRVLEIELPDGYILDTLKDITRTEVTQHRSTNYGMAGWEFLKFVVANKEWVKAQLQTARAKYNPASAEESKERYYFDALATAVTAGRIAERIGLIKFDLKPMIAWTREHILSLRASRSRMKVDPDDILAGFITSLHGKMIVTRELRDNRNGAPEQPVETVRGEPVGRVATDARRVFVQAKALADWCRDRQIKPHAVLKRMDEVGLLLRTASGSATDVLRIGTGTPVMSSPARCYELNYNVLLGSGSALRLATTPTKEKEHAAG